MSEEFKTYAILFLSVLNVGGLWVVLDLLTDLKLGQEKIDRLLRIQVEIMCHLSGKSNTERTAQVEKS